MNDEFLTHLIAALKKYILMLCMCLKDVTAVNEKK